MNITKSRLTISKGGNGGVTCRATLPGSWIREMGLGDDNRNLKLEFDGEKITITNNENEVKMLNNILEDVKVGIKKEMERTSYIDNSDNNERIIDELANNYIEEDGEIELDIDEIIEMLNDHMKKAYKKYGSCNSRGDYIGCYYKDGEGLKNWKEVLEQ